MVRRLGGDADLLALEREVDVAAVQAPAVRPGMLLLEGEQAVHHAALAVGLRRLRPFVEHREEAFPAPLGIAAGIEAEAGRRVGEQPVGVNLGRIGAARDARIAGEVELARGVIARMARHAALVEQRADVLLVIRGAADRGGRVVEARRIGLAETLVELQRADDGGATGDEGQEKRGEQAHAIT